MIIGFIIDAAVGLACIVLGVLIWKKRKVSLLHDYHYKNVKEEDIPAYARLIGIGLISIGAGIILMGLFLLISQAVLGWVAFIGGFIVGIAILSKAQKRYNGSWLG